MKDAESLLLKFKMIICILQMFYFYPLFTAGVCLVYIEYGVRKTTSFSFGDLKYSQKFQIINISFYYFSYLVVYY